MQETTRLLRDLVALPSVNPMGRELPDTITYEHRVTSYLDDYFRTHGIACQRQHVAPQRENILAYVAFPNARWTWLWEVHQDTVPVDHMVSDPFGGAIEGGQLYGRGACDVKGTMAAMLAALTRLEKERPVGAANVLLACTVDEEHTALGVQRLVQTLGRGGQGIEEVRVDGAVVAEPTRLQIVNAHKGIARWDLETVGRSCHSSKPDEGINAIYSMGQVLQHIEAYARELSGRRVDASLGPATMSVGRILGGTSVNTVPERCRIEIDRRLVPGEEGEEAHKELIAYLQARVPGEVRWECQPLRLSIPALGAEASGEVARRLGQAIDEVVGRHTVHTVPFGTDASTIAQAGVAAVIFGPGNIGKAHTADEFIELEQVEQASEILYRLAKAG